MIGALAAGKSQTQAEAIRDATAKAVQARNLYTEQMVAELALMLADAEGEVRRAILRYKSLGSLPDNKLAALEGLKKLQGDIRETMTRLHRDQTLLFRKAAKASFRQGIYRGIKEFAAAQMPFYRDLGPDGIDKLTTRVFTIVDTDALDFMTNYNLVLAGDVHRELVDGIKRTVMSGIATGKGVEDIVRDLGHVVKDRESFRHAGSKVFSKAQYRMEVIARTEVLRAHNQGRIKFHRQVGVQKLEWMTMEDERVCPICGPLDGKVFDTGRFPQQPAHPNCRCTSVVAWPLGVCGGELGAKAAAEPAACILPPQAIEEQAKAKAAEDAKLKAAFESGQIADLNTLTVKQLQTMAKQNGVSIARTKADFIKLLDQAEPGFDHTNLTGAALKAKLKEHKIGMLRTKEELIKLLAEKQTALKQAQQLAEQLKKVPADGLQDLTVVELKEMAKAKGISLNMTKQDVIDLLDELEPGVDHSNLSGKALIAAKKKHHIGPLKNKQQLIEALQKAAGEELAEKAKQEAVEAAKKEALKKAKESLEQAAAKVAVPESPAGYADFLSAVKEAESALAGGSGLPQELLEAHAKEIALKKKLFHDQVAAMKVGDLKTLAKETKLKHWQWANKDELVTIFTETDPGKLEAAKAGIEKKHAAWLEKHGGKKKKAKPKPVKQPSPAESPSAPEPVFSKKGAEFASADNEWKQKGKEEQFTYAGKAQVGGAHAKEFWTDKNGDRWLFKPIERGGDEFISYGEEAAYKIGRLIDPEAIEVRTIRLNGRLGSIQKWRTDLKSRLDFAGVDPTDLTTLEIEQIQREHVIDWLISNHDGHAKQFLRAKNEKVYGIDKGQLFKHLGEDRLSIDYHPNARYGEQEPFYNTIFRAVKAGKVEVDPSVTLRYIREVEKIPDEDYLAILRPYVEGRFGRNEARKKAFYDMALARKRNLRRDFEAFYADVLGKKNFRFDDVLEALPKGKLGPAEEVLLEEIRSLGWQGKVLPFDEGDIEDQNALIFVETIKGRKRTVVKMKVRPEAEEKLLAVLRKAGVDTAAARVGEQLPDDIFANDILAAIKTINYHAQDYKYNQATLKKAADHLKALKRLSGSDDPDVREMAQTYIAWIEKVQQAASGKTSIDERFETYLKKRATRKRKPKDVPFTVQRTKVLQPKRELRNGELVVVDGAADNSALFRGRTMKGGKQYEIDFGDGVHAVYRPWSEKNLYAQRGEFELILPDRPDAKSLERALDNMESLGLKAGAATPQDAELLYLHKQAYLTKVDRDPEYKRLVAELDRRAAGKDERIQEMRGFWERRLGVKDLTRMPGYDPMGEYQLAFKAPGKKAGYRHQYRFDISDEDLEKQMKGYGLYHRLTNGEDLPSFIETVLENNGAMVSTVEKLRAGIPVGGMSPAADMDTGGATYVFTRIRKLPTAGGSRDTGLYFKKRLLRRMDAISYDHDAFGRVRDDYVSHHRGSTPSEWKKFARRSSNETIFKYSVTLLDNIDVIVVGSEREKRRLLEVFHKRKISKLPDGRKVEDIILVR
jgi:SPP1 gp7 family putative phage head morphogenesis protein